MPWSAKTFRERHNHKLSKASANKAAKQANAILKKTGDDALAIRVANANAKKAKSKSSGKRK